MKIRQVAIVLFFVLIASIAFAQNEIPPDATLASVAHANGVRGGDLAEALDLPRQTAKDKPLAELGVTPEQLRAALEKLGAKPEQAAASVGEIDVNTSMTIREVAEKYNLNGKALAHDMLLDVEVDKDTPIAEFGVTQETLFEAVEHNLGHEESGWAYAKYPLYTLISLFALLFMLKLGIPKNANPKKRKNYYPQWVYLVALAFSVLVLGFLLGKSPNPMEGAVKVFKSTVGLYESFWAKFGLLIFFGALAVVGNKIICGWACPFGALEELIYALPLFKKAKKKQPPFWLINGIRTLIFIAFLLTLYGIFAPKGTVFYHYLNPFNLFNWDWAKWIIPVATALYLIVSFFFYRPFCRFICPFGLISWILERVSLARVRIDFDRCIDCKACAQACPLTAAGDRLAKKKLPADCFSCMRCLRVCPTDAIHYRPAWGPPSPPGKSNDAAS